MDGALSGGPGMSDSSSEEEETHEDSLQKYAGLEGTETIDPNVCLFYLRVWISIFKAIDEEPLNSDDDQSDEEDVETLFDAENVVVCQFEKVILLLLLYPEIILLEFLGASI